MKAVYNFMDFLVRLGAYIGGIMILLTTFMTFFEGVSRSFFHKPTSWGLNCRFMQSTHAL